MPVEIPGTRRSGGGKPKGDQSLLDLLGLNWNFPSLDEILELILAVVTGAFTGGGVGGAIQDFFDILKGRVTDVEAEVVAVAGDVGTLETRVTNLESGGVLTYFPGNGTFVNPGFGTVTFTLFSGGQAGSTADGISGSSGIGPLIRSFKCVDYAGDFVVAVGAGGSASNLQAGGVTTVSVNGVVIMSATATGSMTAYGITSVQGFATPGGYGRVVNGTNSETRAAFSANPGYLGTPGGAAGTSGSRDGKDGTDAPDLGNLIIGGTGGGGGYSAYGSGTSGRGGDGGSPSGGGGGPGNAQLGASQGRRGYGANGAALANWEP
ncbi:hypothetical protein [Williamsia soli]|uniref:hypothetical protein n=1 Tax=Williamsia soli TaxID=364929 RepID=UPI001A9FFD72|nr:hypothetical protein [Williamsia soli]